MLEVVMGMMRERMLMVWLMVSRAEAMPGVGVAMMVGPSMRLVCVVLVGL